MCEQNDIGLHAVNCLMCVFITVALMHTRHVCTFTTVDMNISRVRLQLASMDILFLPGSSIFISTLSSRTGIKWINMAVTDVTTTGAHLASVIVNTNMRRCAAILVKCVAREGRTSSLERWIVRYLASLSQLHGLLSVQMYLSTKKYKRVASQICSFPWKMYRKLLAIYQCTGIPYMAISCIKCHTD